MEAPIRTPCDAKRLTFKLLLVVLTVVFNTSCESMRCYTCPDARNRVAHESQV